MREDVRPVLQAVTQELAQQQLLGLPLPHLADLTAAAVLQEAAQ